VNDRGLILLSERPDGAYEGHIMMSHAQTGSAHAKSRKSMATGILWGLIAAFAWSGYNVGSRLGRMDALAPMDMSMLRFGVATILLAPLSHAVVLTAGATMVSSSTLAWILDRTRPSPFRLLGMIVLTTGSLVIVRG
jgi:drug/metabolite transporter (DMT)-like permease